MVLAEWALVIKDNRVGHLWYETVIFGTITNYLNYEFILLISTVEGRGGGGRNSKGSRKYFFKAILNC